MKQVWDIGPEQKMALTKSPFNKLQPGEKKMQNSESKKFYQPINIKMHLEFNFIRKLQVPIKFFNLFVQLIIFVL